MRWNTLEEPGAHHGAVELISEAGDGQEEEINGDQSSDRRAHRRRLKASQHAWLEQEGEEIIAELQS
jgi:hypothetical protein